MKKYLTILADPPWAQKMMGKRRGHEERRLVLSYPTMTVEQIKGLPIKDIADDGCHLWLWTTNQFLRQGFDVVDAWGFKYLAPITWVKPNGLGNYFVHRTQTILFGYKQHCRFPLARYKPTVVEASYPFPHSTKPQLFYDLIESISPAPRIELFSRARRFGWDCWGNEVDSDIELLPERDR